MIKNFTLSILKIIFTLSSFYAHAGIIRNDIPEVGSHTPIFTFEKNENPENIMIVYTRLDANCDLQLTSAPDRSSPLFPVFDFYWLMNKTTYKPVNSLIKKGIRDRLVVSPLLGPDGQSTSTAGFDVAINDLKEVDTDITDLRLRVSGIKIGNSCQANGVMTLGPSDSNHRLQISSIYTVAKKVWYPPFRKIVTIKLRGLNLNTGKTMERIYNAKR